MKALRLSLLATAIVLGSAQAAENEPELDTIVVTAKRSTSLYAERAFERRNSLDTEEIVQVERPAIRIDFTELTISPPELDDAEFEIAPPRIELALFETADSTS